jgi:hypothetical protein
MDTTPVATAYDVTDSDFEAHYLIELHSSYKHHSFLNFPYLLYTYFYGHDSLAFAEEIEKHHHLIYTNLVEDLIRFGNKSDEAIKATYKTILEIIGAEMPEIANPEVIMTKLLRIVNA